MARIVEPPFADSGFRPDVHPDVVERRQRLPLHDRAPPVHVNLLDDSGQRAGDADLLIHHQVRGVDIAFRGSRGGRRPGEQEPREETGNEQ